MRKTYHSREIIKMLKNDGWYIDRVCGSHHQFRHEMKKGLVTIQHPLKDLSEFVVYSSRLNFWRCCNTHPSQSCTVMYTPSMSSCCA